MSKIDDMLAKYCPNGVEFRELHEIAKIGTGSSNRQDAKDNGEFPFYVRSKDVKKISAYEFDEQAIIIPGEGGVGDIFHYVDGKYALHQRAYRINFTCNLVNTKFAYYYLMSNFKKFILMEAVNATVISIRKPMIEKFKIPIPPLANQQEIVDILDKFTELEAELEARNKQYSYYRDKLLSFDDNMVGVSWKTMGEVANIYDGTHQTPKYISEGVKFASVENIKFPYDTKKRISHEDYDKNYKIKPRKHDLFMTRIGSIGECTVIDRDEDIAYYVTLTLIRPNLNIVSSKYLKFIIESGHGKSELRKRTLTMATPIKINLGEIGKIKIPVPPISEQNRIVSILDKFDALVSDISEGLPAEIAARRKQYEHYRNRLLTFNEIA